MLNCILLIKEVKLELNQLETQEAATGCPEISTWAQIYAHIQDTWVQCTNNNSEPHPGSHFETDVEDHIDLENFGVGENSIGNNFHFPLALIF